ncbi:MAG: heme-binding protein [Gammaproteobacteria bacterium]|nr:MAG: heme-binding protein [Gammaproteobacteria bacterium]
MRTLTSCFLILFAMAAIPASAQDSDQPLLVNIKRMSLDTALRVAKATIDACRKEGVQIAVTVVDRGGHPQVILRDVLAPDITLEVSRQKAHPAMPSNAATSSMEGRFTQPFSVGKIQGLVFSAGGVPIQAAGSIIGGVGVSGAPSGLTDEACANAGIEAIIDDLEMAD